MVTLLRTAHFRAPSLSLSTNATTTIPPLKSLNSSLCLNFKPKSFSRSPCLYAHIYSFPKLKSCVLATSGGATQIEEEIHIPEDNTVGSLNVETAEEAVIEDGKPDANGSPTSPVIAALELYKEALSNNDKSKLAELEAFFKSIKDDVDALERKVGSMSADLSIERDRVLRISADFDNYRKRTDRERTSLVTNAQGEVIENFLPVLDNFERAKSQIKVQSEAEEKINNSYQSIYKQFVEILGSIGVLPVETTGNPFDPLLHEAIMREESTLYDDGIVIEEYRKGFKLGDRLLRPSMVKVSAGPGPEKPEATESSVQEEGVTNDDEDVSKEVEF